jgi:caspase domain-containing protein/TIR domain-containing protein
MVLEDAHALVIGIARYLHLPALRTTQDAQDVAAVLQDPACCGYPPAAVHLLADEAATRVAILAALDELAHSTREASTVFIYYSGHGARAAGDHDSYYLVPVDATAATADELAHTAISSTELTARLRAIPAGRLTLVLDCCRAADLAEPRLAEAVTPLAQGRGRAVLAGSRATDFAYQLPGQRDSNLTGYLVDGLRGAAPGVGGVIRICDLFHYVQQHLTGGPVDQHPVFKAELEENYPIAQLRGGAAVAFAVPPPPDEAAYDAFISYCQAAPEDGTWVTSTLVPYLEALGLKLCLEDRDFMIGASRVEEIDRAINESRYTVAVLTPEYVADTVGHYESLLAAYNALESRMPCFMPLMRRPCQLALHARMTEALDVSRDAEVPAALQRLALALRHPPRPRLAA